MARKKRKTRKRQKHYSLKRIIRRFQKLVRRHCQYFVVGCIVIIVLYYVFGVLNIHSDNNRITITADDYNGIDVSKYQGNINWSKVANDSHIQFVYIKASEGASLVDGKYKKNLQEAKAVGMKVGSYHFFIGRKTAKEQFDNFKRFVNKSDQDLIPVVDVEENGNTNISRTELQNNLQEFMNLIKGEYGKYPILYSQYGFYNKMLAPEFNNYYIFIARYGNQKPTLKGNGMYNIWQFTEKGRVKGIKGYVDLNRFANGTKLSDIEL